MGRFRTRSCWEEGRCVQERCSMGHRHWDKVGGWELEMAVNSYKSQWSEIGRPWGLCIFCELLQQKLTKFSPFDHSAQHQHKLWFPTAQHRGICMGSACSLAGNGFCIMQTDSKCPYLQTSTCPPPFLGSSFSMHLQQFCHLAARSRAALKIRY